MAIYFYWLILIKEPNYKSLLPGNVSEYLVDLSSVDNFNND